MCRRLRSLAHSPQLVHSIDVAFWRTNALSRLRAFCSWLLQHAAGAVRHLAVTLHPGKLSAEDAAEAAALLAGLVAACGAAGGLEELRVAVDAPFTFSSFPATLRHLKRLDVDICGPVQVSASLAPLTTLQELSLAGWPLRLLPEARLPASVTKLQLSGDACEALPPQVGAPPSARIVGCWLGRLPQVGLLPAPGCVDAAILAPTGFTAQSGACHVAFLSSSAARPCTPCCIHHRSHTYACSIASQ